MCGLIGIVTSAGDVGVSRERFVAMRDALEHRGPDDAGLFAAPGVLLGHRRLVVIDPTSAGRQPMQTPDGRFVLVYNGELYNDREIRAELERDGVAFRSSCDTETVLHAVARWGVDAGRRLRGMYALALWDTRERVLLLGRDPFGMKPLYWTELQGAANGGIAFASEIPALLRHPGIAARPDWAAVSGYLTTIRTTLGERTMYEGIRCVRPGAWMRFEFGDGIRPETVFPTYKGDGTGSADVAAAVEDSVRAHLRSDVPWCSLLSGGLDSTILATLATREAGPLRTYVSGCPGAGEGLADDFAFARVAAEAIGSTHTEAPVDRDMFLERWPWMVERLGVPMSTPNEVAINEVARTLRGEGHVVTLSGEGADELFGGYDLPMASAAEHVAANPEATIAEDAAYAMGAAAWMRPDQKHLFVSPGFWEDAEQDAALRETYEGDLGALSGAVAGDFDGASRDEQRQQALLRMLRTVNLAGLLQRLDTATMLASVEGRTPFADVRVAGLAERLPMARKFVAGDPPGTKVALREAFAGRVPTSILERPKRSFPLPFQAWLGEMTGAIRGSGLVAEIYSPAAVQLVCADPGAAWNLAWPMANLAVWGRRWD
ncbi:MAG: asparagine synthase (glutamine-hydrolyzing) [Phycisphaeraceae bacterium]|nr:MAG: asparagine synthase (glutamine-hydrolyzing) [Phycisphaeraceae bacterium]